MLIALLIAVAATPTAPGLSLAPCGPALPGAQCGTYEVFEDREAKAGRKIGLKLVVLKAQDPDRAPDPVFFFAGGPGDAATRMAAGLPEEFAEVLKRHDIVLVDQRGSGASHPLNCDLFLPRDDPQAYLGDFFPPEGVKGCRAQLEKDADLTQYTTSIAMDDIDDVRAALGYERINLWGGSYGTRAALVYMRQHPERVRTATLMGVAPTSDPIPLRFARDAQRALDGIVSECVAEAACRAAFPDLATELAKVLERLSRAPVKAEILHPQTGEARTVTLSRDLVNEALRYLMYESSSAGLIPVLIHQAAQGNFDAFAEFALFGRQRVVGSLGTGLYLSITCAEDLPWIKPGVGEREAAGTFLGDYRLAQQRRACSLWPQARVPAAFLESVRSTAPTLILSGQWDPATPPALGDEAGRDLPASLHVVVPHGGHSYVGLEGLDCIRQLQTELIARGSTQGLDTACVSGIRRPGFQLTLPETRPVVVAEGELAKLTGRWVAQDTPLEASIEAQGSHITLALPGQPKFLLVPVSAARFRVVGALGLYGVFELDGGKPKRMVLEDNGESVLTLKPATP
jgi:pimeloyl-ACP methyl ester carboxylesterase